MKRPHRFECEDCFERYHPELDSCQCDSGRCECGGRLEPVGRWESAAFLGLLIAGALFWLAIAWLFLPLIGGA